VISSTTDILSRDRLLAIGATAGLSDFLRQRYPNCQVTGAPSILEGIEDLSRNRARAVIAYVDETLPRLCDAVAGLREAAGSRAKVVLCCAPEAEPYIRKSVGSGADDYLVWPPDGRELDEALGYVGMTGAADDDAPGPAISFEEIQMLGDLLGSLEQDPYSFLCKLADLVRMALGSESATIVVEGTAATSGGTVVAPVLMQPIQQGGQTAGQITVGKRERAYTSTDLAKLRHYAELSARLIKAAGNQRKWRKEAMTDEVSGLYNRRYVTGFLDDLLERAREERSRVTVLLFDIDNFKSYNDEHGHHAGDDVIRLIGQLFQSHCREHDVVTRYGGDEFCVVFWDADQPRVVGSTHPSDALAVLARFQEALKSCHCESLGAEAKGCLTISGGLASFPWDATSTRELIAKADEALLRAKQGGKNRVFVFGDCRDCPEQVPPVG
jgi:diguanylate cyclase (GGDEF)-like protein